MWHIFSRIHPLPWGVRGRVRLLEQNLAAMEERLDKVVRDMNRKAKVVDMPQVPDEDHIVQSQSGAMTGAAWSPSEPLYPVAPGRGNGNGDSL